MKQQLKHARTDGKLKKTNELVCTSCLKVVWVEIGVKLKNKYPESFEQEGSALNFAQMLAVKHSGL